MRQFRRWGTASVNMQSAAALVLRGYRTARLEAFEQLLPIHVPADPVPPTLQTMRDVVVVE